jgi:hypothetical protein
MFKHISPDPWSAQNTNVWDYQGETILASCANKNLPLATQRANARLIAIAPLMFEIIKGLHGNERAQALVRYMEREVDYDSKTE